MPTSKTQTKTKKTSVKMQKSSVKDNETVIKERRKKNILKKKPLKLPSEINGIKIRNIPENRKGRMTLLTKEMTIYLNHKIYCPALKSQVLITQESLDETSYWASKSFDSTVVALNLKLLLKNVRILKSDSAKDNIKQTAMGIEEMKILYCLLKDFGVAKVTVGKKSEGDMVYYCISSISLSRFKNKE